MPEGRATQTVAEVLADHDAAFRSTQTTAEVLADQVGGLRITQIVVEVLADVYDGWPFPTGPLMVGLPQTRAKRAPRFMPAMRDPAAALETAAAARVQTEILIEDPEIPPTPTEPPAPEPESPSAGGPKPTPPGQAKEKPTPPGQAKGRNR